MPEERLKTGYPSVDKPWLKYYSEEAIRSKLPHMTAVEYLKEQNKNRLDLPAIDSFDGKYTYRELFKSIDQTAAALASFSIGKGDIVLAMLPPMACETMLFYGVDTIGAAISFIPPSATSEDICESISLFKSRFLFVFSDFLPYKLEKLIYRQTSVERIIIVGLQTRNDYNAKTISWELFLENAYGHMVPKVSKEPEDLLFLAKTGGTTGKPKNVMLNDNSFNVIVHQLLYSDLDYQPGDRWLRMWPLFSATAAVSSSHLPLCAGMENILKGISPSLTGFDSLLLNERPNHTIILPPLLDALDASELLTNKDLHFIKSAGCGGTSITSQFEERAANFFKKHGLHVYLGQGWGCTENASSAAMRMNFETTKVGYVGIPLVKTTVAAFDPDDFSELSYNEQGELCIQSQSFMIGYYNDPILTDQVLKRHSDGTLWLHTGDLGYVDSDGFVKITGRMTRTIFVFSGEKVYPESIEEAISKIPGVADVAVCAAPDPEHKDALVPACFIVLGKSSNIDISEAAIKERCRELFPNYALPKIIKFKEKLPLTPAGKPDVNSLEAELKVQLT